MLVQNFDLIGMISFSDGCGDELAGTYGPQDYGCRYAQPEKPLKRLHRLG
ncbi:hypothetical protein P3T73_02985 [Kiritimatiellota bacterium B12222]|nr:hypothetical protein P3T73_02985 [Kiritimatiellota bacterium B12222]